MPDDPARQYRRIRCRLQGSTVILNFGTEDHSEMLFLYHDEAKRLAADLAVELVCTGESLSADVRLSADEGWQLVDAIHNLLGVDNRHHRPTTAYAPVRWWSEGF